MAIITGTDAGETLTGTAGADTINAFAGNDILIGGRGRDLLFGGNGADRFDIFAQNEIVDGETYDGGLGVDQLFLDTTATIDLSGTIITGVEQLKARGAVMLASAQLGAFTRVEAAGITLTDGGLVDLSNSAVLNTRFDLHADGNVLTLVGTANARYQVIGNIGNDVVRGGEAGNVIDGGFGDDILVGGAGSDVLIGGSGLDSVSGGGGNDRLVIAAASDLVAGEHYDGGAGTDTLAIEADELVDLDGVTISDVEVLDVVDAVSLSRAQLTGFRSLEGGTILIADAGGVDLAGRSVDVAGFVLANGTNTFSLAGVSAGVLTIAGGTGADHITGSDDVNGGDLIDGGSGHDRLFGGGGSDVLIGGLGRDVLDGGDGHDLFLVSAQDELAVGERYTGGAGYDGLSLLGMEAYDITRVIVDADVEELIFDNAVTMTAQQFGGFQRVSGDTVIISRGGSIDLPGDPTFARQAYVDNIYLSNFGNEINLKGQWWGYDIFGGTRNDTIIGGDGPSNLFGGRGNDLLRGGLNSDTLWGGLGRDVLDGGAGDDTFIAVSQAELVPGEIYIGGAGFDTLRLRADTPATIDISRVTVGADVEALDSDGAVRLTAAQLDTFSRLDVGEVSVTTAGTIDLTDASYLSLSTINLATAGNTITLGGCGCLTVNGGSGNDVISGSGVLNGGAGADIITGGVWGDIITGGRAKDVIDGGAGDDTLVITGQADIVIGESYRGGSGFDTLLLDVAGAPIRLSHAAIADDIERLESMGAVSLSAAQLDAFTSLETGAITLMSAGAVDLTDADVLTQVFNLHGGGNTLDLTGLADIAFVVNGGKRADTIRGGDHLDGDRLVGGRGDDTLTGGVGADQFVYTSLLSGIDTVTDFSGTGGQQDKLVFEGLLAGSFAYLGDGTFSGTGNSEARFAGADLLQVDANGDGRADITIRMLGMTNPAQLGGSDFLWS
ncbi:beta strand repeat-containing protein [Enterovirga rhinocerotis]|uniref:Hemolysin type calcium-binding protein n=1 Tax=Enterovirga rhinocerotis TaxID=1339210 RepID=A0A4R7BQT1_9HYPH|nr:calcium-binding protein [Enterovirga rhinocerotis]TDR87112.1 hemolysin type calcium-binding protein [Enterovirga rhinocerotis]